MGESPLDRGPVIPVVVLHDSTHAVPLARALLAGGVSTIEVTLRTDAALDAIERIGQEVPDILVGAGTVLNSSDVVRATQAGAQFLVAPGATASLLPAMRGSGLPFLPGAATVSEVMALAEEGCTEVKFFPAAASGGPDFLNGVGGPLPHISFCPTGGITAATAGDYLSLPNVRCVGGTWVAPESLLQAQAWKSITSRASQAGRLRG
jgi:2-dehydro-3-deoxyphosphogluconate aldolase/(4S)-4-hydroxy-2-oxoglutarate aldolase